MAPARRSSPISAWIPLATFRATSRSCGRRAFLDAQTPTDLAVPEPRGSDELAPDEDALEEGDSESEVTKD